MQAGSTPTSTDSALLAELALSRGDLVQEWGYDDDVDFTFRDALEDALGEELLTEDDQEPADAVLFWWHADDGDVTDLADALVDAHLLLEEGVDVLHDCQEGICGSCETKVIEGEVDHRDYVLTDREKAANDCMMICVSRACGKRLVLGI